MYTLPKVVSCCNSSLKLEIEKLLIFLTMSATAASDYKPCPNCPQMFFSKIAFNIHTEMCTGSRAGLVLDPEPTVKKRKVLQQEEVKDLNFKPETASIKKARRASSRQDDFAENPLDDEGEVICLDRPTVFTGGDNLADHVKIEDESPNDESQNLNLAAQSHEKNVAVMIVKSEHKSTSVLEDILNKKNHSSVEQSPNKNELQVSGGHHMANESDGIFECGNCSGQFTEVESLRRHILTVHEEDIRHERKVSRSTPGQTNALQRHANATHHRDVTTVQAQDTHRIQTTPKKETSSTPKQVTPSSPKHVTPSTPKHVTPSKRVRLLPQNVESFSCNFCDKHFNEKHLLQKHCRNVHENPLPLRCSICGEGFSKEEQMKSHLDTAHEDLKTFRCILCPRRFVGKHSLSEHVMASHADPARHPCNVCSKKFYLERSLKLHLAAEHENSCAFYCNFCLLKFPSKDSLKSHVEVVHEKLKPFKCTMCEKSFAENIKLKVHFRSVHENIQPFQCNFCNKRFTQNSNLKTHVSAVHEKIKSFFCQFCNKDFAQGTIHQNLFCFY